MNVKNQIGIHIMAAPLVTQLPMQLKQPPRKKSDDVILEKRNQ